MKQKNTYEKGTVKHVFDNSLVVSFPDGTIKKINAYELFEVAAWFYRKADFSLKKYYRSGQILEFETIAGKKILHTTPLQQYQDKHLIGSNVTLEVLALDRRKGLILFKFNEFICYWYLWLEIDPLYMPGTKIAAKITAYYNCTSCIPIRFSFKRYLIKAKPVEFYDRKIIFETAFGQRYEASKQSCRLSRKVPFSSYFSKDKYYEIELCEYKKYVRPVFDHPHDLYIDSLRKQHPSKEDILVPCQIVKADYNGNRNCKELVCELAPDVYAYDYVTCTMMGDFWQNTKSLVTLCLNDYNPTTKRIRLYIGSLQEHPYPSSRSY